ncbi:ABC transporter permease [Pelagicoccus sp. SDUM812002]|uniref:ABC transporter permease n=1 Tax=Pelagicoccus sp. SDUM812002 TaxID=3041266 RepID=UPI00280F5B4A|nr:ABC transporter permease [Pelagicoccus sp. SDUM812002]MDQ8184954.1 ABC transporter permease [Pelagicoccus sp. SDUM812002]
MSSGSQLATERIRRTAEAAKGSSGWYAAWILFRREIKRFMVILGQSVVSPVITTMLYFLVFGFSLGSRLDEMGGVSYMDFLTPGLMMMSLINNSFINSAFSFFLTKVHGSVVDVLVSPLSNLQIMVAYTAASLVRGLMTSVIIWGIAAAFGANTLYDPLLTIVFMVVVSCAFSLFGLATAVVSKEFEHVNLVPNFVVVPFTFLGGVFYSISLLPEMWQTVALFNPFLYMVNGIRYGMTGVGDVGIVSCFLVSGVFFLLSAGLALTLLKSGKNLRN